MIIVCEYFSGEHFIRGRFDLEFSDLMRASMGIIFPYSYASRLRSIFLKIRLSISFRGQASPSVGPSVGTTWQCTVVFVYSVSIREKMIGNKCESSTNLWNYSKYHSDSLSLINNHTYISLSIHPMHCSAEAISVVQNALKRFQHVHTLFSSVYIHRENE